MGTPNRFIVYLGGAVVATSCSLHAANEKLTAAVLLRAAARDYFPVEGQILDSFGRCVTTRSFPCFIHSNDLEFS